MAFSISYSSRKVYRVWTWFCLQGGLTPDLAKRFAGARGEAIAAFPLWLPLPLSAAPSSPGLPLGLQQPALHSQRTPGCQGDKTCSPPFPEGRNSFPEGRNDVSPAWREKLPPANYQCLVNQLLPESRTPARSHNTAAQRAQDARNAFLSQGGEINRQFPHSNLNQTSHKAEGFAFNSQ